MKRRAALAVVGILMLVGCTEDSRSASGSTENRSTREASRNEGASLTDSPSRTARMPDIRCGMDLQAAQNIIQDAGIFYSRSEDATGRNRNQVLDRNWTVLYATPSPGTHITEGDVTFYVVKDTEFSPYDC